MEGKLISQSAEIRCYRCGSPEIVVICHHCGRPMCAQHGPVKPSLSWFTENREFSQLSLGTWPLKSEGAHCEYHVHYSLNYRKIMVAPGVLIALLSLLFCFVFATSLASCLLRRPADFPVGPAAWSEALRDPGAYSGLKSGLCYGPEATSLGLSLLRFGMLFAFGAVVFFVGRRLDRQKLNEERLRNQAELPLGLVSERIEALEALTASLELDEQGKVKTRVDGEVLGWLRPNFRFTPQDKIRMQQYRHKYEIPAQQSLQFQTGYLMLGGRPRLLINRSVAGQDQRPDAPETRYLADRRNLFWLEGQTAASAYLNGGKGASDPGWPRAWRYSVKLQEQEWGALPLRIVPLMLEVGNIRSLQLQVQLNPRYFPQLAARLEKATSQDELGRDRVAILEVAQVLVDPAVFGRPRATGNLTRVQRAGHEYFQVDWRGLYIPLEQNIVRFALPEIQFDQSIEPGARLLGHVRVRVPALLSGLAGARYFSSLGYPVDDKKNPRQPLPFDGATSIDLDFDLALARLPVSKSKTLTVPSNSYACAPTPQRVRALVDALNSEPGTYSAAAQTYVRRVVESIPQVDDQNGEAGRWHWDISGRNYRQTFPIDFHIIVFGQGDARQGITHLEMSVQGQAYDELSEQYLQATRDELQMTIQKVLSETNPGQEANTHG